MPIVVIDWDMLRQKSQEPKDVTIVVRLVIEETHTVTSDKVDDEVMRLKNWSDEIERDYLRGGNPNAKCTAYTVEVRK